MTRSHCLMVPCVLLVVAGCGSGGGDSDDGGFGSGATTQVVFTYDAPTALDPAVQAAFPNCVNLVSPTHVHPSWRGFAGVPMVAVSPSRWELMLDDVPVGEEQVISANDPNLCSGTTLGTVYANLSANGMELSRIGTGGHDETGFLFTADADGNVSP